MLHRALVDRDRRPGLRVVVARLGEQSGQVLVAHVERARQRFVGEAVGGDRLDAWRGAAADDRDRGGRRDRQLVGEAFHDAELFGVGAGAALLGEHPRGGVGGRADLLEHAPVPDLGDRALEGNAFVLQERVEAHHAQAHGALAQGGVAGPGHGIGGACDEVAEHVVEEAHDVLDEARVVAPGIKGLDVERGQTADRGALRVVVIAAGRQGDLAAQVGHLDVEARQLVVLRDRPVHVVAEQDVGLAGLDARGQDADPQIARLDLSDDRAVLGRGQRPLGVVLDRAHEGVGHNHAVMQVQRLAVGIAAGGPADLDELLDLRVRDRHVAGRRAAPERALADREGQ